LNFIGGGIYFLGEKNPVLIRELYCICKIV